MSGATEYAGGNLSAYAALAEATGLEIRDIARIAETGSLKDLFDRNGVLLRVPDANAATARRRLRDVRHHWQRREARARGEDIVAYCLKCDHALINTDLSRGSCPHCGVRFTEVKGDRQQWRDPQRHHEDPSYDPRFQVFRIRYEPPWEERDQPGAS
jgi:hypothetical protein